ncbi:hypothetical protein PHSC3_001122 [Chlamydiales bacterium STE3]|nr:hypothetical protein PHSC3_001122 [Chlamydiales bacterium STE3]
MTEGNDSYILLRDQVKRFDDQTKRKETAKLKILTKFLSDFNLITQAYGLTHASRSLLIGLAGCMKGILKSESQLGLFTDQFDFLAKKLASALADVQSFGKDSSKVQLLQWYLEIVLIGVIGLLYLATKQKKEQKKDVEGNKSQHAFKQELIISLFFYTDYPKDVFQQMAKSLGVKEKGAEFIACSLESLALLAIIFAFSKEQPLDSHLLEILFPRLEGCLNVIDRQLAEATFVDEDPSKSKFRAFIQLARIAIERQDIEPFIYGFTQVLQAYELSESSLKEDVEAIQKMFRNYEEAFYAPTQQQVNTVNLLG